MITRRRAVQTPFILAATAGACTGSGQGRTGPASYTGDGRRALADLERSFDVLTRRHGWHAETIFRYADEPSLAIRAWRTAHAGEALWLLAGVHGEEPAGPNAIARSVPTLAALAGAGVPIVLIPVCNPRGYARNWRYPNTPDRDWRGGGYSVGDSEYLLPDLVTGAGPRAAAPPGPETRELTNFALRLTEAYRPLLALDLHEDELSAAGGYIYSQGRHAEGNPVALEIVRQLQAAGVPVRLDGITRFGEPIVNGVISRDSHGGLLRDGSIDELLAAAEVYVAGQIQPGPASGTVIVVETPALAAFQLERRIGAHAAVLARLGELWRLAAALPR